MLNNKYYFYLYYSKVDYFMENNGVLYNYNFKTIISCEVVQDMYAKYVLRFFS